MCGVSKIPTHRYTGRSLQSRWLKHTHVSPHSDACMQRHVQVPHKKTDKKETADSHTHILACYCCRDVSCRLLGGAWANLALCGAKLDGFLLCSWLFFLVPSMCLRGNVRDEFVALVAPDTLRVPEAAIAFEVILRWPAS